MSNLLNLKAIEHFIVVLLVAFAAQITFAGAPVDLTTDTGRSAIVTAIAMVVWRVLREDLASNNTNNSTATGTSTGS